jgi:glycosyltransferase involved in cell wall biosynthesis
MATRPYRPGIPAEILALSHERDLLRRRGQYERADRLKREIEDAGYAIRDNPRGAHLVILPTIETDGKLYHSVRQFPSDLDEADLCTFSVNILAQNNIEQTRRCIESVLRFAGDSSIEIILVDNASQDGIENWAEVFKRDEPRLHFLRASRMMGAAQARNIGLKWSRGRYILLLDANVELTGDIFAPLEKTFKDHKIGLTGLRGLCTDDLRHFKESEQIEVEVVEGHCMAFRRTLLKQTGLFDERYRFPQYMDIDFSFAIRETGAHAVRTPYLPIVYHPEPLNFGLSDAECTRLTKRNFYRYLQKWGDRDDLLLEE